MFLPCWWERATMQILGKRKATVCSVPWEMMIEKSKRYAMPFKYCNIATPCQSTFGIAFNYLYHYQLRKSVCHTLGQNPTFYPKIPWNFMLEKCEFCEKWDFENANFVKNEILKLWISGKMRLSKSDIRGKN